MLKKKELIVFKNPHVNVKTNWKKWGGEKKKKTQMHFVLQFRNLNLEIKRLQYLILGVI